MSVLTKLLLVLSAMTVLAAAWAPGEWWKWTATSAILVIAAAATDL